MKTLFILLLGFFAGTEHSFAQNGPSEKTKVMRMRIDAEIDPRMNRYTELGLNYADEIWLISNGELEANTPDFFMKSGKIEALFGGLKLKYF